MIHQSKTKYFKGSMTENEKAGKITFDGTEYDIDNLSEAAKAPCLIYKC